MRVKKVFIKNVNGLYRQIYREYHKEQTDRFYYKISDKKVYMEEN